MKKLFKSGKGQHLVEFALVLPVIVMILLLVIEFGYAINARIALTEAIKKSLTRLNKYYEYRGTATQKMDGIRYAVAMDVYNYLKNHNIPYAGSVNVSITPITGSQTAIVNVSYTYYPSFTLPNILGGAIIPDSILLSSSQVINAALLSPNSYNSFLSTSNLSSFHKLTSSSDPRSSILISPDVSYLNPLLDLPGRDRIAFMVAFGATANKYARLFNWWGEDLLPPNLMIDVSTGRLAVKSPYNGGGAWTNTNVPYVWILASLGFTEAIYVKSTTNPNPVDYKLDLLSSNATLNLGIPWCDQSGCANCGTCSGDISPNTIDNLNKRGLSARTATAAYGTFEPSSGSLDDLYAYTFNRNNYVLRVFVPNSTKPPNTYNSHNFTNFDGMALTVIDYYIDSDGDNIPNAWDNEPEYIDADANGVVDGLQASVAALVPDMGYIPYGGEACIENRTVAPIFELDGVVNDSIKTNPALKSFTPEKKVLCVANNPGGGTGLYYLNNKSTPNVWTRAMYIWSTVPSEALATKAIFIGASISGTNLELSKSLELESLTGTTGPFSKRVTNN